MSWSWCRLGASEMKWKHVEALRRIGNTPTNALPRFLETSKCSSTFSARDSTSATAVMTPGTGMYYEYSYTRSKMWGHIGYLVRCTKVPYGIYYRYATGRSYTKVVVDDRRAWWKATRLPRCYTPTESNPTSVVVGLINTFWLNIFWQVELSEHLPGTRYSQYEYDTIYY